MDLDFMEWRDKSFLKKNNKEFKKIMKMENKEL